MDALDRSNDDDVQLQKPSGMICYINPTLTNDDELYKYKVYLNNINLFCINHGRNSKTRYGRWKKCTI